MILGEIPGTLGFLASTCGKVFSPDGVERSYYRNGDGYITAAVATDKEVWVTFGVQRLVAMTHIPYDGDTSTLAVNHRDGDVTNNDISNLEWVTAALNNIHAALMSEGSDRARILARDPEGTSMFLANLQAAAEVIGATVLEVWDAIKDETLLKDWSLSHHGSRDPIPKELQRPRIIARGPNGRAPNRSVKFKNLLTDEVVIYSTMTEAAKAHNKTASHVYQCLASPTRLRLFLKRYLVVYAEEEFPKFEPEQLRQAMLRGPLQVMAYNLEHKRFCLFESASQFIEFSKLSKKAVTVRLKKNRLENTLSEVDGWVFAYYTAESAVLFKAYRECPDS